MGFFQLLDSLVLFFDLLAELIDQFLQLIELLVVNSRRGPDRQRDQQRATDCGASQGESCFFWVNIVGV
jgi:hypothetical protein